MNIIKKIKQYKAAIFFPYNLDEKFDNDCNNSFLLFLDRLYYFLLFFLIFIGCGSIYFFTKCEILDVCKG